MVRRFVLLDYVDLGCGNIFKLHGGCFRRPNCGQYCLNAKTNWLVLLCFFDYFFCQTPPSISLQRLHTPVLLHEIYAESMQELVKKSVLYAGQQCAKSTEQFSPKILGHKTIFRSWQVGLIFKYKLVSVLSMTAMRVSTTPQANCLLRNNLLSF